MQHIADAVMYNQFLNAEIKELFLSWYESKLDILKYELFELSELV